MVCKCKRSHVSLPWRSTSATIDWDPYWNLQQQQQHETSSATALSICHKGCCSDDADGLEQCGQHLLHSRKGLDESAIGSSGCTAAAHGFGKVRAKLQLSVHKVGIQLAALFSKRRPQQKHIITLADLEGDSLQWKERHTSASSTAVQCTMLAGTC